MSGVDSELEIAARYLAVFDPLRALNLAALRQEPEALAVRGIAMAQLGELTLARQLLRKASRALQPRDRVLYARSLAALGEVELAARNVEEAARLLDAAIEELDAVRDRSNALLCRLHRIKQLILVGALREAERMHAALALEGAPPRLLAVAHLVGADMAVRRLDAEAAKVNLACARHAARNADVGPLLDEIENAQSALAAPVAKAVRAGVEELVNLAEFKELLRSSGFIVDGCRRIIQTPHQTISLVTRPVLLRLCVILAHAAPAEVARADLASAAFDTRRVDDSVRARLRVEMGRLRQTLKECAAIDSTSNGYVLVPRGDNVPLVLMPPLEDAVSALWALLCGGESWSTSSLAAALGTSRRTIQRALLELHEQGRVQRVGKGRAQRWVARPPAGFATTLLLGAPD